MTPKVKILVEQIARMRVVGIRDSIIAVRVGLTQSGLSRIVALPEYRDLEECILQGQLSKMDEALAGKIEALKTHFELHVPLALRTLFETCAQRRDLRAAMSAASEILDRDPQGTFGKKRVSLGEGSPTVSAELLAGLAGAADGVASEVAGAAQAQAKQQAKSATPAGGVSGVVPPADTTAPGSLATPTVVDKTKIN